MTKSMANSGGDGETPGGARRPKPSGQNESDLERRGASKFKAGCLSDLGRIDLGEAAMKLPEPCPRPLLTDRDDPVLQHARL